MVSGAVKEIDAAALGAWHDLVLVYKWQRRWPEAIQAAERALALRPDDVGAAWNLGIAATALGDWGLARRGWRAAGVPDLPDGDGPIEMELGLTPVRINVEEGPEVVWCRRIDPARAVITSIPVESSGRRYHDLLLHDGEPVGTRMLGGREVSVFDEIEVLERSRYSTYLLEIQAPTPEDAQALERGVDEAGLAGEDWTGSVRLLCKKCSEGSPHDHGKEDGGAATPPWKTSRRFGVAALDEAAARAVVEAWSRAAPGRAAGPLELGLSATDA